MGGACGMHGRSERCKSILVVKPEGRRPLGRPRHKWEDIGETGFGDVDWIHLALDRDRWRALVNMVMSLRAP
jgi:hypothetical protein